MSLDSDRIIGKRVPENFRREEAAGIRYDSGPYIGKVKNNVDNARSGRIQVWIPDLGSGDENNPNNWRTVNYASPYLGSTTQEPIGEVKSSDKTNAFNKVRHTYGMWFNVPDLDNLVLCTFVAGDPNRGYYFACIPNQLGHHMIPSISSSTDIDTSNIIDNELKKLVQGSLNGQSLPVVEWNEYNESADWSQFVRTKKPLHEVQAKILVSQGLDRENLTGSRGSIGSTSQRESPSGVFGFSTPGRPYDQKIPGPDAKDEDRAIRARRGGHTFVMDDGDFNGSDNLVRLRTSAGHQILMDDSERILYISNSDGTAWVELTGTGHINVYGANSLNLRSGSDINLHADKDINLNAGNNFTVHAGKNGRINTSGELSATAGGKLTVYGGTTNIGSDGRLDLSTTGGASFSGGQSLMLTGGTIGLNSGAGPTVSKPNAPVFYNLPDTRRGTNGQWQVQQNAVKSVVKILPTHEPWSRVAGSTSAGTSGSTSAVEAGSAQTSIVTGNITIGDSGGARSIMSGNAPVANVSVIECNLNTIRAGGGLLRDSSGNPVLAGASTSLDPGPQSALSQNVLKPCPTNFLTRSDNPNPPGSIGPLSQLQVKALMTQISFVESNCNYNPPGNSTYLGKYQLGLLALIDVGYIKFQAKTWYGSSNAGLSQSDSWTKKNGIDSKERFLASRNDQENAMYQLLQTNFNYLRQSGGIKADDDLCTVAGMLAVAHLLGHGDAKKWRQSGSGADANGTTGTSQFNRGRYAIDVLARGQ